MFADNPGLRVNTAHMRDGADRSYTAAGFADEGVQALAGARVPSGIFGEFAAAASFHTAATGAHTQHGNKLRGHRRRLDRLGNNTHTIATAFAEMEHRNVEALRAVAWSTTPA